MKTNLKLDLSIALCPTKVITFCTSKIKHHYFPNEEEAKCYTEQYWLPWYIVCISNFDNSGRNKLGGKEGKTHLEFSEFSHSNQKTWHKPKGFDNPVTNRNISESNSSKKKIWKSYWIPSYETDDNIVNRCEKLSIFLHHLAFTLLTLASRILFRHTLKPWYQDW